ncbi:28S rRNA (uridine-N(3))-methyltransferase [Arctopsyche grandis]|uniref:28S rRNA (uridine-N(3))-methyltransferase n=1 Tax=Arctopsyche grandis TaxID=121162 RepID=UPI00406D74E8
MASAVPDGFKSWKDYSLHKKSVKRQWNEEKIIKKMKRAETEAEKATEAAKEAENFSKVRSVSTISIAVPGSILENAQSPELRAYLAGQIARAACIFSVDEVVIYDDVGDKMDAKKSQIDDIEGTKVARRSSVQLARILQYLECPQYLRKFFFPIHPDLKYAGILNPLDAPHHLRLQNEFHFREGVVLNKNVKPGKGSHVNVGLLKDVSIDKLLAPGLRVTVRMLPDAETKKRFSGKVESLHIPRTETGVYWGYVVRIANTLSEVFSKSPYKNGYDVTIGTSDRGTDINNIEDKQIKYDHALIFFGGLQGVEAALENDENLAVDDPSLLFDHYINSMPTQGSRTIRTEEAILVTLSALQNKMEQIHKAKNFELSDQIAQSCSIPMNAKFNASVHSKATDESMQVGEDMNRFD